jgi:hypothetical protein
VTKRLLLAVIAILAIAGCYTPRRSLAPTGSPIANERDFTGAWKFTSGSSREYMSGIGVLPFLPMYDVRPESVIRARQSGDLVVFDYTSHDGTQKQHAFDIREADGKWEDGKLVIHPGRGGNPFGFYYSTDVATMYRLADGRLVMTDTHTDTGLACALIPYHEKNEVVLSMRPAADSEAKTISSGR